VFGPEDLYEIQDELPSNSPRFILLSYTLVHADGRKSAPLVIIYYAPSTSTMEQATLYASARVWFQEKAEVARVLEVQEVEDITDDNVKSQLLSL